MRALLLVALVAVLVASAAAAAYHGLFYVTGSQFFEACWEQRAKQNEKGWSVDIKADNPRTAVLWASCTPIVWAAMSKAGFAIGSSDHPVEEIRALAGPCPDRYTEMPILDIHFYMVAIDAIEKYGGPSLIDYVTPAGFLVERAMTARWPRCVDAARLYLTKAQKSGG